MKIQFYKPTISDISIKGILDSGILVNGEYTEALEQHFKYIVPVRRRIEEEFLVITQVAPDVYELLKDLLLLELLDEVD